jgi:hypothetical protein
MSDANNDANSSWADSYLGCKWLSNGHRQYEVDLDLSGFGERYLMDQRGVISSGSSAALPRPSTLASTIAALARPASQARLESYQPSQPICKSPPTSTFVPAPLLSPMTDVYLLVTMFLDQTGRHKGMHPNPGHSRHVETGAFLDTASLAGDFVSQDVFTQLHVEGLSYTDPHPTPVCSALDSTCHSRLFFLDVGVSSLTWENIKQTIYITVSVNPSTFLDLILGRHTLRKFDPLSLTPHALGMLHRKSTIPIVVAPAPTPPGTTIPEAHHRHPGSTPNFCSRHNGIGVAHQPCCRCEVHQPSCSVTAEGDRCDGDSPRHGIDPTPSVARGTMSAQRRQKLSTFISTAVLPKTKLVYEKEWVLFQVFVKTETWSDDTFLV